MKGFNHKVYDFREHPGLRNNSEVFPLQHFEPINNERGQRSRRDSDSSSSTQHEPHVGLNEDRMTQSQNRGEDRMTQSQNRGDNNKAWKSNYMADRINDRSDVIVANARNPKETDIQDERVVREEFYHSRSASEHGKHRGKTHGKHHDKHRHNGKNIDDDSDSDSDVHHHHGCLGRHRHHDED